MKPKTPRAIVTAGPTYEPIDPVRFIGNRSSGKQGYAIASSLAAAGFDTTLISGPTALNDPKGVKTIRIETATEMLTATQSALGKNSPTDVLICTAAVSDWRPTSTAKTKMKKRQNACPPKIELTENPDILKTLSNHINRPKLVIGFAAETEDLEVNSRLKLDRKNCDLILANLVAQPDQKTFGEDENHVYLITKNKMKDWGQAPKTDIADKLVEHIAITLKEQEQAHAAE